MNSKIAANLKTGLKVVAFTVPMLIYANRLKAAPDSYTVFQTTQDTTKQKNDRPTTQDMIKIFSDNIRRGDKDGNSHYLRAEEYSGLKQYSKAISDFREAVRLDPGGHNYAYCRMGQVYEQMGQPDSAIAAYVDYANATKNESEKADAYGKCAKIYFYTKKDCKKALEYCNKASAFDPDESNAYLVKDGIAALNAKQKADAEAANAKKDATKKNAKTEQAPSGTSTQDAWHALFNQWDKGFDLYSAENYDSAIVELNKVLVMDPSSNNEYYANACYILGRIYKDVKNNDTLAPQMFKKVMELAPNSYLAVGLDREISELEEKTRSAARWQKAKDLAKTYWPIPTALVAFLILRAYRRREHEQCTGSQQDIVDDIKSNDRRKDN